MDVVYVSNGLGSDQFKYSLRGLAKNVPGVERVFVMGPSLPDWSKDLILINKHWDDKIESLQRKFEAIMYDEEMTNEVLYMEEDLYVTRPVKSWPLAYHSFVDVMVKLSHGEWKRTMGATARGLRKCGVDIPISFEGHTPMLIDRSEGQEIAEKYFPYGEYIRPLTFYANLSKRPKKLSNNAKVITHQDFNRVIGTGIPFMSSLTETFRISGVRAYLRGIGLDEPCRYES